jgi:hypothetical protein
MPAAKPMKLPRWATGVHAKITEPNEGKKDIGHQVAERPPAQYFNWLFNLTHQWLSWLNDFELVAHVWQAAQTFAAGISGNLTVDGDLSASGNVDVGGYLAATGNLTVGGQADITNRIKSGPPLTASELKLVGEHPGYGAGSGSVRRYVSGAGSTLRLVETVNAGVDAVTGQFVRDVATQPAVLLEVSVSGTRVLVWNPDDVFPFERELKTSEAGVKFVTTGTGAADANPPAATAIANELRAKNVCKAWGAMDFDGTASPKTYVVDDGFNIAGIGKSTRVGATNKFRVTFAAPMANSDYSVMLLAANLANGVVPVVSYREQGAFDFSFFSNLDGSEIDAESMLHFKIMVQVFGRQAT